MKDGWHVVAGEDVYVENNKVVRGTTGTGLYIRPVYPYRYDRKYEDWNNRSGLISVSAFRAGIKRGTVVLA